MYIQHIHIYKTLDFQKKHLPIVHEIIYKIRTLIKLQNKRNPWIIKEIKRTVTDC